VIWNESTMLPIGSIPRRRMQWSTRHLWNDCLESSVQRGELYRVHKPGGDPNLYRIFVVVSRQVLIDSKFSTAIFAPVFTSGEGLSTQVSIGPEEGLKHSSWIMCDNLVSFRKADLTH
jgi:mRNA interferase MazF